MIHLYKAQFFYTFSLDQGFFQTLAGYRRKLGLEALRQRERGKLFRSNNQIRFSDPSTFAEYLYFHEHARSLLFEEINDKDSLFVYEAHPGILSPETGYPESIKDWTIEITLPGRGDLDTRLDPKNQIVKRLRLDWVLAMIYDLDVGILSFGVSWSPDPHETDNLSLDDILDINCMLRRSSPSFLSYSDVFRKDRDKITGWSDTQKKARELPVRVAILDPREKEPVATEDFGKSFDDKFHGENKSRIYRAEHFEYWLRRLLRDVVLDDPALAALAHPAPILDERNFVCSLVVADKEDLTSPIPGEVSAPPPPDESPSPVEEDKSERTMIARQSLDLLREIRREFRPVLDAHNIHGELVDEPESLRRRLYQALYVDPSTTAYADNPELRDRLLARALYLRFRDRGTVFGFTRYSGMYLTTDVWFGENILSHHVNSMYFQMADLLLTMRAALLNFSQRSARIAQAVKGAFSLDDSTVMQEVEDLRADFLRFHNKYWFCEVTAQEQGIEMFDLWNRNMDNQRLFTEVDQEICALHEFGMAAGSRRLGQLTYLNVSAIILAVLALAAAVLGMSVEPTDAGKNIFLITGGLAALFIGGTTGLLAFLFGKNIVEGVTALHKQVIKVFD